MDFIYASELNLSEAPVNGVSEVDMLATGKFKTRSKGEFEITEDDLHAYVREFNDANAAGKRQIDVDHSAKLKGETQAAGWIQGLRVDGNKIKAAVAWTPLGQQLIKDKIYKFTSAEIYSHVEDKATGEMVPLKRMGAGSLTNRPFIENMEPVTLSEGMIAEIYTPSKVELLGMLSDTSWSDEDRKAVREALEGLLASEPGSADDLTKNGDEVPDVDLTEIRASLSLAEDAPTEAVLTAIGALQEKAKAPAAPAEGFVTLADFESVKNTGLMLANELRDMRRDVVFNLALSEGRMTTAETDSMTKLYAADPETTTALLDARPKSQTLREIGSGSGDAPSEARVLADATDPEREGLAAAIDQLLATNKDLTYAEAMLMVARGAKS